MSFSSWYDRIRRQIVEGGGTPLAIGSIADGEYLRRVGNTVVSGSPGGGGGGGTWTEVEVDFGTTPRYDASFTVVDAGVSGASKVVVLPSGKAATGRTADDWQWDGLALAALPGAGSFTLYAVALPGPVVGPRLVQYQIS